jgi:hypothetical protein
VGTAQGTTHPATKVWITVSRKDDRCQIRGHLQVWTAKARKYSVQLNYRVGDTVFKAGTPKTGTTQAGKTNHIITAPMSFPSSKWKYLGDRDTAIVKAHVNKKYDATKTFQLNKYACSSENSRRFLRRARKGCILNFPSRG